jgi:ABC-type microcin C transport system permease subunit YejB
LLIKKEWNFLKKIFSWKKWYKIFQKFWVVDFGFFKLTLASFWLLIAKIFPVLLTLHLWYYIVIFGFGAWYFASILVKGNGK